jgi:predicted MFS family arabinose efflux permease
LGTLVLARVLAGVFGGPATSLSLSIVADVVPPERRGRAMGAVMGAFSIASILGVPAGLELARVGGWRLPFFAVAGVSLVITSLAYFFLPPMIDHIKPGAKKKFNFATVSFLKRPMVLNAYVLVGLQMFANFMIVPNLSAFFQYNVGYPRAGLGVLYMVGGITSFFTMRIAGWLIDRFSAFKVFTGATGIVILVLCLGFVLFPPHLPILLIFTGFMVGVSVRNISVQSVSTRVPNATERAGYMSFQSAVQHFSSAAGAILSSWMLTESSTGALIGLDHVAVISVCVAFVMPFLLQRLEGFVRRHESHVREHFLADP